MKSYHISMIGLGYVGLPLAVEFAKHYAVTGFDINQARINEINTRRRTKGRLVLSMLPGKK